MCVLTGTHTRSHASTHIPCPEPVRSNYRNSPKSRYIKMSRRGLRPGKEGEQRWTGKQVADRPFKHQHALSARACTATACRCVRRRGCLIMDSTCHNLLPVLSARQTYIYVGFLGHTGSGKWQLERTCHWQPLESNSGCQTGSLVGEWHENRQMGLLCCFVASNVMLFIQNTVI